MKQLKPTKEVKEVKRMNPKVGMKATIRYNEQNKQLQLINERMKPSDIAIDHLITIVPKCVCCGEEYDAWPINKNDSKVDRIVDADNYLMVCIFCSNSEADDLLQIDTENRTYRVKVDPEKEEWDEPKKWCSREPELLYVK